jgi:hypothetical protein
MDRIRFWVTDDPVTPKDRTLIDRPWRAESVYEHQTKTTPLNLDALVSADSLTFRNEWRGRWLRVQLDRIGATMLEELLVDAWTLVAPKRLARAFLASRE